MTGSLFTYGKDGRIAIAITSRPWWKKVKKILYVKLTGVALEYRTDGGGGPRHKRLRAAAGPEGGLRNKLMYLLVYPKEKDKEKWMALFMQHSEVHASLCTSMHSSFKPWHQIHEKNLKIDTKIDTMKPLKSKNPLYVL